MGRIINASIIDLVIFTLAIAPIFVFLFWMISNHDRSEKIFLHFLEPVSRNLIFGAGIIYVWMVFGWFILRDAMNLSPGKRLQKIIIVDKDTELEARTLKKAIRNIPFLICFPLEFVMKIVDPKARLGDMIVNTKLMEKESLNSPSLQVPKSQK